ncbi:hypothetical protein BY458DRAFT_505604 [Sporodiniella umbellata]|nr:hypothetical protein BY458DRAFT_505604 [Sporodiniella umbellata]
MQTAGPSGFYNVPATKFLLMFIGGLSLFISVFDFKQYFHLQLNPHLTIHNQWWRLFLSHFVFNSSNDFLFGSIILYTMRVIERQFGTPKYSAFLFVTFILSILFELGALMIGERVGLKSIPSGPYALLFSILYQYYRIIPVTYRFRIFGCVMTDKLFLYTLALQLAFSGTLQTIVPSLCGCIAGAFYRADIGNIRKWKFPVFIQTIAHRFVEAFLASSPNPRPSTTLPVQRPIITSLSPVNNSGLRRESSARASRVTTRPSVAVERTPSVREYLDTITNRDVGGPSMEPASPEYTRILMTMFPDHPQETVTRALSSAHNELNRAVEIMLNTPSPAGESSRATTL